MTFSDKLTLEAIEVNLTRQGVLDYKELKRIAETSSRGEIHAFTFDNFSLFPKAVPFKQLKTMGIVSDANLVTVEKVGKKGLRQLIDAAYG